MLPLYIQVEIYAPKGAFLFIMKITILLLLVFSFTSIVQAQDPFLQAKIKYNEGLAFISNGEAQYAQALHLFEEALKLDNGNAKIHYMKGYCENRLNQVVDAIASFTQAKEKAYLQKDDELARLATQSIFYAHIRKAAYAVQEKEAMAIISHLEAAEQIGIEEPTAQIHYFYATAYNLLAEYSKALEHALQATQGLSFASGERYAPYFFELGFALEFTGRMEQAVRAYEKASYGTYRTRAEDRIAKIRELYVIY